MSHIFFQLLLAMFIALLPMTKIMANSDMKQHKMSSMMQDCDNCAQDQINMDCDKGQCVKASCMSSFTAPLFAFYTVSSIKTVKPILQPLALMRSFYSSPPSRSLFRPPIV